MSNTDGEDTQHDEDFWQHLNSKQDELTSDEQLILANKQLEQAESLYKIECDKVRGLREELNSLREQLKESSFWANEQANTLNALADRNAGLSSELEKSNHNYLSIVEQLKQKEEVIERFKSILKVLIEGLDVVRARFPNIKDLNPTEAQQPPQRESEQ